MSGGRWARWPGVALFVVLAGTGFDARPTAADQVVRTTDAFVAIDDEEQGVSQARRIPIVEEWWADQWATGIGRQLLGVDDDARVAWRCTFTERFFTGPGAPYGQLFEFFILNPLLTTAPSEATLWEADRFDPRPIGSLASLFVWDDEEQALVSRIWIDASSDPTPLELTARVVVTFPALNGSNLPESRFGITIRAACPTY